MNPFLATVLSAFFFQAEDGIRDVAVTGVQTCALPISDAVWDEGLGVALDNLLLAFSRLSEGAAMIADRLALDDPSERRAQLLGELRGVVRRLDAAAAGLTATLRPPPAGPAAVRWLERRGRK